MEVFPAYSRKKIGLMRRISPVLLSELKTLISKFKDL
jgi:hypothetical protein